MIPPLGAWLASAGAGRPVYLKPVDLRQARCAHSFEAEATNTTRKQSQTITVSFRTALVSNYLEVGSTAVIAELFADHQKEGIQVGSTFLEIMLQELLQQIKYESSVRQEGGL